MGFLEVIGQFILRYSGHVSTWIPKVAFLSHTSSQDIHYVSFLIHTDTHHFHIQFSSQFCVVPSLFMTPSFLEAGQVTKESMTVEVGGSFTSCRHRFSMPTPSSHLKSKGILTAHYLPTLVLSVRLPLISNS